MVSQKVLKKPIVESIVAIQGLCNRKKIKQKPKIIFVTLKQR